MKWRIVIVDDHQLVLDGLTRIIKSAPEFDLVGISVNGKELMQLLSHVPSLPHIILMDIDMPFMNGFEASKSLKKEYPLVKVLFLTMHHESIYYNKAIAAQANGIIQKSINQSELITALTKVCKGSDLFTMKLKSKNPDVVEAGESDIRLTEREIEILRKIASGMSNTEISKILGISIRTVDTHRTNLKKKLSVNGIAGLVKYAFQRGLLT